MKYTPLALGLATFVLSACGQPTIDCEQLRNQAPHFAGHESTMRMDSLIALDLEVISQCMDLDSLDRIMLNPPVLSVMILGLTKNQKTLNYGNIIDYINELRSTEKYQQGRKGMEFARKYENRQVDRADSLEVRATFEEMGLPDSDVNELMTVVYAKENTRLTYREAFETFIESKEPTKEARANRAEVAEFTFGHFQEIETLKQLQENKASAKPKLIFFTGWANVNARKMEEALFQDDQVKTLLAEFDCYVGYADEKTQLSAAQKATYPNKDLQTKGQYITEIERSLFPEAYQPVFIVVNKDFQFVESFGYSQDQQAFLEFLERNQSVR